MYVSVINFSHILLYIHNDYVYEKCTCMCYMSEYLNQPINIATVLRFDLLDIPLDRRHTLQNLKCTLLVINHSRSSLLDFISSFLNIIPGHKVELSLQLRGTLASVAQKQSELSAIEKEAHSHNKVHCIQMCIGLYYIDWYTMYNYINFTCDTNCIRKLILDSGIMFSMYGRRVSNSFARCTLTK